MMERCRTAGPVASIAGSCIAADPGGGRADQLSEQLPVMGDQRPAAPREVEYRGEHLASIS